MLLISLWYYALVSAVRMAASRSSTQEVASVSRNVAVFSSECFLQRKDLHPLQSPQTGHQVQESQFSGPHREDLQPRRTGGHQRLLLQQRQSHVSSAAHRCCKHKCTFFTTVSHKNRSRNVKKMYIYTFIYNKMYNWAEKFDS